LGKCDDNLAKQGEKGAARFEDIVVLIDC